MKRLLIAIILLAVILQAAHALGITPPLYEYSYAPGEKQLFTFNIRNDGPPTYIQTTVKGDFVEQIKLSETYFFLKSGEAKDIRAELTIPETKTPGKKITEVFFTQVAPKRYGQPNELTAVVAIVGQLMTRVPFKEKYAEVSLSAKDAKRGDKTYFSVSFSNYGLETVRKASGTIRISDEKNTVSATAALTDITGITSLASSIMYAELDTANIAPGKYSATAIIDYDSLKASDTKEFKITDVLLSILEIAAPDVVEGQLAKVTTTIESKWGSDINAFAQVYLKDAGGATVAEATTQTIKIAAFGTAKLAAYINTNNVPASTYDIEVVVNYADKQTKGSAKLAITEKKAAVQRLEFNFMYALFIIIIAALLVLLLRKRHEK